MPIGYKKTERLFYQPTTTPTIVDVPEMNFISVDGRGDPNTSAEYAAAIAVAKKKPNLDLAKARLEKLTEGLCVQAMHIGPYDTEPATTAAMERFAAENGYAPDFTETRRHHEIYLSDPRRTAPEKLKTVIRQPIRQA